MTKIKFNICLSIMIMIVLSGCVTIRSEPFNYRPYLAHMPLSILVLPPVNESLAVNAPYIYLSTATRPLAEHGYYVYPVAVIDAMMKENGVNFPEDMHQIPLKKIKEIIGPDAVFYLTIRDWGTKYKVLDSQTVVDISGKLVDTDSGIVIWRGYKRAIQSSSQGSNSIFEMLITALISQMVSNLSDPSVAVARMASGSLIKNLNYGLLPGEHHINYQKRQEECRKKMNIEPL